MKLCISMTTFERGVPVKNLNWEEEFLEKKDPVPFGFATILMKDNVVILKVEKTQDNDVFLSGDEKVPFTTFNGKRVSAPFQVDMEIGDVLVVHFDCDIDRFVVWKQVVMVAE